MNQRIINEIIRETQSPNMELLNYMSKDELTFALSEIRRED